MKIAYIAAGAGGMYCGSCFHDNTLVSAFQQKGHDALLIPTYTPIRTDEPNVSLDRIFYNGINVYLEQKIPFFRHQSLSFDKLIDKSRLINWISRFSLSTNAQDLGELTLSVLRGEEGYQKKELEKLTDWMVDSFQPEILQITNSMFAGMVKSLKTKLKVPVLCGVQGEDIFLEDLPEPYKSQTIKLLQEKVKDVDGFIAPSHYYAEFMAQYLDVPIEKIHVVKLGINLDGYGESTPGDGELLNIGYLARICPEKGLHLLVEAFERLSTQIDMDNIRLKIAGYLDKRDFDYFEKIKKTVIKNGLDNIVEYVGEVDRSEKIEFLNSLYILSVPTVYKEAKGLFILEALANGIPVVQPEHGSFPELIRDTGGGILVEPDSPEAIATGIRSLINDPALRRKLGKQGMEAVHQNYGSGNMAEATLEVYRGYL